MNTCMDFGWRVEEIQLITVGFSVGNAIPKNQKGGPEISMPRYNLCKCTVHVTLFKWTDRLTPKPSKGDMGEGVPFHTSCNPFPWRKHWEWEEVSSSNSADLTHPSALSTQCNGTGLGSIEDVVHGR